jgi:thiamine biosynthesis lipoprotein
MISRNFSAVRFLLIRHCRTSLPLLLAAATMGMGSGCARRLTHPVHRFEFRQPHMGTEFKLVLFAANSRQASDGADAAFAEVARLGGLFTDYDPESELVRVSRSPVGQTVIVSPDLFQVLSESMRVAELSEGAFDPTAGPLVRQWRRARRTGVLPPDEQLAIAQRSVGWRNLRLDATHRTVTLLTNGMQLDLGGIAKGFAADRALAVLRQRGISRALVAASGDIALGDPPPGEASWRVTVAAPAWARSADQVIPLANAAVSTSGDTEQFVVIQGVRFSHIVDPRTGLGLTNRLQVSVFGPRATLTDAYATAVSVAGAEVGREWLRTPSGMSALIWRERDGQPECIAINRH